MIVSTSKRGAQQIERLKKKVKTPNKLTKPQSQDH